MIIKKLFKVYKPTEELMYVPAEVLKERLRGKDNPQLTFEIIDRTNCNQYAPDEFFSAGSFIQERAIVIGATLNGCPAGYGVGVLKGGHGAYFKVKYSDLCFDGLYTFSEYRGKGVTHSIFNEILRRADSFETIEVVSLNVRPDNIVAKRMYENMGFETKKTVSFIKKWKIKIPYYGI